MKRAIRTEIVTCCYCPAQFSRLICHIKQVACPTCQKEHEREAERERVAARPKRDRRGPKSHREARRDYRVINEPAPFDLALERGAAFTDAEVRDMTRSGYCCPGQRFIHLRRGVVVEVRGAVGKPQRMVEL